MGAQETGGRSGRSEPTISVVVPTHNRRALLLQTLHSIRSQREVHFEVIVVDDGSTDGTAGALAALDDARIRLLRHNTPKGMAGARNAGIAVARGEWLAFCDDDDLWAPDKLALQLRAARQTGRAWVYGGAVRIDVDDRIVSGLPPPDPGQLLARLPRFNLMPGGCSNAIASRTAVASVGAFDGAYHVCADWDLWLRLARDGPPARVPDPLVAYRVHGSNSSLNVAALLADVERIQRRYATTVDMGAFHHYLAWLCLRAGRRRPALGHFLQAAVRGEAGPVARDLAQLLRARLARRLPAGWLLRPPIAEVEWRRAAEAWLADLRRPQPPTEDNG